MMTRFRTIILDKDILFKKIEAITYKYMEASVPEGGDPVSADTGDPLDKTILSGILDARDAVLRLKLAWLLRPSCERVFTNSPAAKTEYRYDIAVDEQISDNTVAAAVTLMEDYFIKGALMDWYQKLGHKTDPDMANELQQLESKVVSSFIPAFSHRRRVVHFSNTKIR